MKKFCKEWLLPAVVAIALGVAIGYSGSYLVYAVASMF